MGEYLEALQEWVPNLLLEPEKNLGGTVIDYVEWNKRWKLNQTQGDDTANTTWKIIRELLGTVWHPSDAASFITVPLQGDSDTITDVTSYLYALHDSIDAHKDRLDNISAELQTKRSSSVALQHNNPADIEGTSSANCHPISAITGLEDRLNSIVAGSIGAFTHNEISGRSNSDAHPMHAITGLGDAFWAMQQTVGGMSHGGFPDTHLPGSHASTSIAHGSISLKQKLDNMDALISSLSGGATQITHASLTERNAADGHSIAAITDLQSKLNSIDTVTGSLSTSVSNLTTTVNGKQSKILVQTTAPTAAQGANGDVCIVYG